MLFIFEINIIYYLLNNDDYKSKFNIKRIDVEMP